MEKNNYKKPEISIYRMELQQMIAESNPFDGPGGPGSGGPGSGGPGMSRESRGDWDDEE
ncbi:MAG: hypothetical protein J6M25_01685 [Prevotella sp.]|nr:hypothetical protein [Prevotella sp.]